LEGKRATLRCLLCSFSSSRSLWSVASIESERRRFTNENLAEKEEEEGEEEEEEEEATALEDDACCRLLEDVVAAIVGVRTMSLDIFCAFRNEELPKQLCYAYKILHLHLYTFMFY